VVAAVGKVSVQMQTSLPTHDSVNPCRVAWRCLVLQAAPWRNHAMVGGRVMVCVWPYCCIGVQASCGLVRCISGGIQFRSAMDVALNMWYILAGV
jgi:hypothetical protein